MLPEYALVILAAGIGSRFGGVKQLEPVGPNGEILMEYAVRDAVEAGFRHMVFIIRKEIETDFKAVVGDRLEAFCESRGARVSYAFQERDDLPHGYVCPEDRRKPWGTVHALLSCEKLVAGPFVVVNADDYYGKAPFGELRRWLKALPSDAVRRYCLAGYRLENTLSDFGSVTRGICTTDGSGMLQRIEEVRQIVKTEKGAAVQREQELLPIPGESCASMNMWGFTPDIFALLQAGFSEFLRQHGHEPTAELVLSVLIGQYLSDGELTVQVLPTEENWLGVTYREDLPRVREAFAHLHRQGLYGVI